MSAPRVGDWVVAGDTCDDRDVGRIVAVDGDTLDVAWDSGVRAPCSLDVEVYDSAGAARARRDALDVEAAS